MELRHLATFRTLATTLNFTQTAALPGYVQPKALAAYRQASECSASEPSSQTAPRGTPLWQGSGDLA